MIVHIESHHKKRWWLPKWLPGNVYATTFHGECDWDEAVETVRAAVCDGNAFASAAYGEGGLVATAGGVWIEDA